jgi:hypothetical protein
MAGGPLRHTVLLAVAMIRSDAAVEFLLALLAECTATMAEDVITALAFFATMRRCERVERVVEARNEKAMSQIFGQEF